MNCIACFGSMQAVEPSLEVLNLTTREVELWVHVWFCPRCGMQDEIRVGEVLE